MKKNMHFLSLNCDDFHDFHVFLSEFLKKMIRISD